FLNAYQSLDTFKGDAQFFTWLYRIAFNTAVSLKRKQRVTLRIETGPGAGGGQETPDPSESSQPRFALQQAQGGRPGPDALHKLSVEHRSVLILKDLEGLKYEEMAEALQVPVGTIRSRLHRARVELRELLQPEEE